MVVHDPVLAPDPVPAPDPLLRPIRPMLAADGAAPTGPAWGFEFDWDGLRAIAYLGCRRLRLLSGASERLITRGYPELAELADSGREYVLDGKLVAMDDMGRPSAVALRRRTSTSRPSPALLRDVPVRYWVSDLLQLDGRSTLALPYRRRRELLAEIDLTGQPVELSPCFPDTDGPAMLEIARRHGLAGVVAKRLDSPYQPGRRSRSWVHTSCRQPARPTTEGRRPGGEPIPAEGRGRDNALELARAEIRALRAQISPHFVYNALTTISTYVRTDPPRARDLLGAFAEYTRYSFRPSTTSTCLGAELDNVEHYLTLEQARFGDRLRVVCRVDDGLRTVTLPFLTLQPLVEHAVRYGIEAAPHGGTLSVTAAGESGDCVITVAQDGGRGHERLDEVTTDIRARLLAAGHRHPPRVRAEADGSSVSIRLARSAG